MSEECPTKLVKATPSLILAMSVVLAAVTPTSSILAFVLLQPAGSRDMMELLAPPKPTSDVQTEVCAYGLLA